MDVHCEGSSSNPWTVTRIPAIGIVREEMVGSEGSCVPWRGLVVAAMEQVMGLLVAVILGTIEEQQRNGRGIGE